MLLTSSHCLRRAGRLRLSTKESTLICSVLPPSVTLSVSTATPAAVMSSGHEETRPPAVKT